MKFTRKILLLCLLTIMMSSCASYRYSKYEYIQNITDFRPYTENGFFISPGMEGVKYKPIGLITYRFSPGIAGGSKNSYKEMVDALGYKSTEPKTNTRKNEFFQPDEEYMLDRVVEYAKQLGATGILNYKIEYDYNIPSLLSKTFQPTNAFEIIQKHPEQTYGLATITAFAIDVIKD